MRRTIERGLVMGLLSLMTVGGLTGCSLHRHGSAVGPANQQGMADVLKDDNGGYRVVPMVVIGCDDAGDTGGTIYALDEPIGMSRHQRLAWVILGKKPAQTWIISPKSLPRPQPPYFNRGGTMTVEAGYNAFFTDPPVGASRCDNAAPCTWEYTLKVMVPDSSGSALQQCAILDPMIKIRR